MDRSCLLLLEVDNCWIVGLWWLDTANVIQYYLLKLLFLYYLLIT